MVIQVVGGAGYQSVEQRFFVGIVAVKRTGRYADGSGNAAYRCLTLALFKKLGLRCLQYSFGEFIVS